MEVFVFLKMGGNIERVTVVPIDMKSDKEALKIFHDVDVSKCDCYSEEDKQKLLNVVETGFKSFDAFNDIVRFLFTERVEKIMAPKNLLRSSRRATIFKIDPTTATNQDSFNEESKQ